MQPDQQIEAPVSRVERAGVAVRCWFIAFPLSIEGTL
jgi:hypothetical protein